MAKQGEHGVRLTKDDPQLGAEQAAMRIAVFDKLEVLPARLRLFERRRATAALIGRYLAVDIDHRFADPTPAIRHGRGWGVGMATVFQGLKDGARGLRFRLGDAPGHPQPRIHVDHG